MAAEGNGVAWRNWLSVAGIIIGLIGFFLWAPFWLGIVGAILGIIAVWGTTNAWAWISIIVGIIVTILSFLGWTVASPLMW